MTEFFNATELCKDRKVSHFLRNKYVQDFMALHNIPKPIQVKGRGHITMLDTNLKPLLEWWLSKSYKPT